MNPFDMPNERRKSIAYLVSVLRAMVLKWRESNYEGASETSKRLLDFWFNEEHIDKNGNFFRYYFCQREAIETLIYCHEVEKAKTFRELSQKFGNPNLQEPHVDSRLDFLPRFVFKMATGSGKTKVMALCMVWSYFHKLKEEDSRLSTHFLLLAPNVIVFERLKLDFENGKIFDEDPLIPPEWKHEWDINAVLRDETVNDERTGMIFLTNIQRIYDKPEKEEENPVIKELGPKPKQVIEISGEELVERIEKYEDLIVLNDEAHHVHDLKINGRELAWVRVINRLHQSLMEKNSEGLSMQLDFSATPKSQKGFLFPWTIVDYPVADAIDAGIVKRPLIGTVVEGQEVSSNRANVRYSPWINAAKNRWKEYWKKLYEDVPREKDRRKPILFIMAYNTTEAKDLAEELERDSYFKGKVLEIHTDLKGDVIKKDLDKARKASREVDSKDNPYRAIVSVLMLREGWDVKNVTVILGLRPFTAKANILPEQAIGRGLRLMEGPSSGFQEEVDIIGNKDFVKFVRELEQEGVSFGSFTLGADKLDLVVIYVDESKMEHDFEIPILSPTLIRKNVSFKDIEVNKLKTLKLKVGTHRDKDKIRYEGKDVLTDEIKIRREWKLPIPQNAEAVIGYFTAKILKEVRLPTKFSELAPFVKKYMEDCLFDEKVDLNEERVLRRLNEPDVGQSIIDAFVDKIRKLTITKQPVKYEGQHIKLSNTASFPWNKKICNQADKCIFNKIPCDSGLEVEFVRFLENARDVKSYSKLEKEKTKFHIEYLGPTGKIHLYYPDFLVRAKNDEIYIVETKGREDIAVLLKDERAKQWAEDATLLTKKKWEYLKVKESLFKKTDAVNFEQLINHVLVKEYNK